MKSALGVPIKGENSVLAVMVFFSFMTLIEDQELISLVMTVGEQLGIAIERKQTELELQASQQKLSTLVNTIPGTFFSATYGNCLTIDYISEGCKALTGYGREDFLSQQIDFVDLVHFQDLAVVEKSRQQQLSQSSTYLLEYRIFTQCGEEKWIWEKGQGVCNEQGQVIGVEGLMMDITDRRRTEEALKQAEANYRGIVENALEGIFQTTFDGSYLSANPALAKIYGYKSPDELIRTLKNIETELYVKPGRRAEFIETLQEQEVVCDFQSQVYRKDRSIIWISENARAVKDQAGNLLYYEGTVEDITERHKLKEQLHLRAFYDNLTGLANRALFMDKLQEALELLATKQNQELSPDDNHQFGLLFLDLDGFKKINDHLGHLMGDKLLIAIGERLLHCIRDRDIAARLGGDEFTILLTKISAPEQIIQVAERIQVALRTPFRFGNETVETGTSIGIFIGNVTNLKQTQKYLSLNPSSHQPTANNLPTPEDILHRADIALYQAKMAGKGTYHIFKEQDC
ncbi:MAG: diguanylate cyclase [Synechococcaceae cyanobacterium RL_1_2]|nr:diguanylate cyclase [Synechococcaceae cyanobacterium RL_1_2]